MDLIAIIAVFVLSVALGLAGTRAIFEAIFFAMTRVRPLPVSAKRSLE